jgi:hypothetical protein
MKFRDGLCDEGVRRLGLCRLRELFEDVESRLVFLAALGDVSRRSRCGRREFTSRMPTQDSAMFTSRLSCAHFRAR